MHHGRKAHQSFGIFVRPARVVINLFHVARPDETHPVRDARAFDGRAITMRLSDGPAGHEAAGAPTKYGETVGIGPSLFDGEIGGAIHVRVGAVAEML